MKRRGKITIAKYEDGFILASEYRKTEYKEIFCPYCKPPIEVTCVLNTFFRAKAHQIHNCGKAAPIYLDPDWKGNRITEIIRSNTGKLQVVIDINSLESSMSERRKIETLKDDIEDKGSKSYYTYSEYKDVFRDVLRSVAQMKRMLVKNSFEKLSF